MNHVAGNSLPMEATQQAQPQVRHVNLMVDTIITNVASDDIRTLVRALLSTSPAHVTDQFCSLAKAHLNHMPIPPAPRAPELFTTPASSTTTRLTNAITTTPLTNSISNTTLTNAIPSTSASGSSSEEPTPTPAFETLLARARARYGAGLGCSSILVLLPIVEVAGTMQWGEGSAIEEALSIVDCDIAAALGHAKEEVTQEGEAGREASNVLQKLRGMLESVEEKVELWGGDNPFERSLDALNGIEI